jgi:hypothetical protein
MRVAVETLLRAVVNCRMSVITLCDIPSEVSLPECSSDILLTRLSEWSGVYRGPRSVDSSANTCIPFSPTWTKLLRAAVARKSGVPKILSSVSWRHGGAASGGKVSYRAARACGNLMFWLEMETRVGCLAGCNQATPHQALVVSRGTTKMKDRKEGQSVAGICCPGGLCSTITKEVNETHSVGSGTTRRNPKIFNGDPVLL